MRAEGAPEGVDALQGERPEPGFAQPGGWELHGSLDAKCSRQWQRQHSHRLSSHGVVLK
jgi:hypothetical protein